MVRLGYKQTEVGEIPEDWKITSIGDFAPLQRGFDLPNRDRVCGVYPVVYSNGVVNFHSEYQVKGPGVVTGRSGTIGKVHYIESDYWPHNTALWVTRYNNAHPKYVYYLYLKVGFSRFSSGSGVPTLNRNDAHTYRVGVPKLIEEQKAIAKALSDVDELIVSLEKLIAKKRDIKTATMQQLLTGKKRLPGFGEGKGYKQTELGEIPEDWGNSYLLDVANCIHGKAHEKFISETGKYTVVNSKFVSTEGNVNKYSEENFCLAFPGDVLMVLSDLPNGKALAKCFYVAKNEKYAVNQRVCIFRSKKINSKFLYYILNRNKYFLALDDGVTQTHILNGDINRCEMVIPTNEEEQINIAEVISSMDDELISLEKKLQKTKSIKQGMMQELLTGKTRLIKPKGVQQ